MKPFDANGAFRTAPDSGSELRRLAIRGSGVTLLSQGASLAVQIVATVVLARLLTPADFGLVAMVTTFSLLLMNFGQNGFTEAILQRDQIDHFLASNLFWINVGFGLLLTIGFAACGSLLARFYGEPRLTLITLGLSATIFLNSTSVVHLALLKRAMNFHTTAVNDILARTATVGVSILLAWRGWGYWSLVAGSAALPLTASLCAWAQCRWVPAFPRPAKQTGSMVQFALNTYGRFVFDYFARNTDNLLVGWRFGAGSLGFYKKAYDLFALPGGQLVSPLTAVAVSAMSRLERDKLQYRRYFLGGLSVLAFLGMGLAADLTLVGKDLIRLLLGPAWQEAGRIFTYFGPGIGIMLVYYSNGWIHLSIGRPDRWLRWGFVEVGVTVLLFVSALPWGPAGIAIAWTASFWILVLPAFWYAGKPIQFGITPIVAALWKYVLASLVAGCASALILREIPLPALASPAAGAAYRIAIGSLLLGTLYLLAVILLHRGCGPLYQVARLLREMVPLGRSPAEPPPAAAIYGTMKEEAVTLACGRKTS